MFCCNKIYMPYLFNTCFNIRLWGISDAFQSASQHLIYLQLWDQNPGELLFKYYFHVLFIFSFCKRKYYIYIVWFLLFFFHFFLFKMKIMVLLFTFSYLPLVSKQTHRLYMLLFLCKNQTYWLFNRFYFDQKWCVIPS